MNKVFFLVSCVLIALFLSSCNNQASIPSESINSSHPHFIEEIDTSSQNDTHSTEANSSTITEAPQFFEESSQIQSEVPEIVQPDNKPNDTIIVDTPEETITTNTPQLPLFNYTVNDPENLSGLSTERKGFSFGIAKDGLPHSQSIINQQTFDAFKNVQALALDTKTQEKVMYLTFDNGYEYNNLTINILDTLKIKKVKAAFFITLSYAKQNPQIVKRMIEDGHIVGNHSATHPSFPALTRTQMAQEIATLDNYLRENFAYTSPYFRFPSGEHSECALELVTSIGFKSIFWSVAYADWDTSNQKGADYAFSTVTSRFHPGAVILLHAVSQDNAQALSNIIDEAYNQGYIFKTLDQYSY